MKTLRNSIRNCLVLLVILASLAMGQALKKPSLSPMEFLTERANTGDASAQNTLGEMYAPNSGTGVTKDYVQAVKWFKQSAEQGYAAAQYNLGRMYTRGDGVSEDPIEAEKWFRKAAAQGDARAKKEVADLLAAREKAKADLLAAQEKEKEKAKADLLAAQEKEKAKAYLLAAQEKEKAKAKAWQAYSQRPKTTLEQVLNYTSAGDVNGLDNKYWISGVNGQNKCVLEITNYVNVIFDELKVERIIDIRRLSQVGFRISNDWVGDERSKLPRAEAAVLERLQKAWGLAFSECPSVEKAPF